MKADAAELGEDQKAAAGQQEVLWWAWTHYLVDDEEKAEDLKADLCAVVVLPSQVFALAHQQSKADEDAGQGEVKRQKLWDYRMLVDLREDDLRNDEETGCKTCDLEPR